MSGRGSMVAFWVGVAAVVTGCAKDPECEVGAFQCTGDEILEECTEDGWVEAEDCAAQGMMCHAEMGHCMAMDTGMTM